MLKSWKTSIQSREIRSEGWCLGAWCLHLPARERQTRPKTRLFFANALGVSGHLRTETVLIDTCVNCCPEQSCRSGATGRMLKAGHTWEEMTFFMVVKEFWGPPMSEEKECMGAGGSVSRGVLPFCHVGKSNIDYHNPVRGSTARQHFLEGYRHSSTEKNTTRLSGWTQRLVSRLWQRLGENAWREWEQDLSTVSPSPDILLPAASPDPCLLGRGMTHQSPGGCSSPVASHQSLVCSGAREQVCGAAVKGCCFTLTSWRPPVGCQHFDGTTLCVLKSPQNKVFHTVRALILSPVFLLFSVAFVLGHKSLNQHSAELGKSKELKQLISTRLFF